ncbi:MAG: 3-deoxy-D-manno-octulosonic acid kinase [Xanthomonadales bacterium]|nr:3-deoxy-D-manno-octulosonic acid kinase [Xanthomonadales bacterium]
MKPTLITTGNARILYDASAMDAPETIQFDSEFWASADAVVRRPAGRGSAVVIRSPSGEAVLKRYFRGGLLAKFNRALYIFSGYENSRAFREFRLLERMQKMKLPVPQPLAALCERQAMVFSRMALMTQMLAATETLAEKLVLGAVSDDHWQAIGRVLSEFHNKGVYHADLNANNLLINTAGEVFLIDFDKCRFKTPGPRWQNNNIQRLKRSLMKLFPAELFPASGWSILLDSYKINISGKNIHE